MTATRSDSLRRARSEGLDGYYVQLADVERGLYPFRDHFRGKTVLLNCDDTFGGFWTYFRNNLDFLGIERVIGVGYEPGGQGRVSELRLAGGPDAVATRALAGDGDFRSDEVVDLLGQADIVATTPPSSLFPEHLAQAVEHGKGFVTLGAQSSAAYRDVWPMILSGDAWVMPHPGRGTVVFEIPEDAPAGRWGYRETAGGKRLQENRSFCWYTNLDTVHRHRGVPLYARYADNPERFPTYYDYPAIEVPRVSEIPRDYDGEMGVPVTFLGHHDPDQFEIVGLDRYIEREVNNGKRFRLSRNGRERYARIIIRPARATTEKETP